MGNAASLNVPPPGTSTSDRDLNASPGSTRAAEEAQHREFHEGIKKGVYREHQGDLLHVTKNRAKPHRCNDRVEDVIQALFEGNPLLTVPPAFSVLRKCLASEEGKEPEVPFLYLDLPPPVRKKDVSDVETKKKTWW